MIEASFAQQYGIRLRHETYMPWSEFTALLSGIGPETPLGAIVDIRSETDGDIIKHFTPEQRRIRREWQTKQAKKLIENNPDAARAQVESIQAAFKAAFFNPTQ